VRHPGIAPLPRVPLLCLSPKRPASPPPPQYRTLLLLLALEQIGEFEKRAIEQRAIVIGKLDQPGFDDETPELNEMTGAFAALHDPVPGVMPDDGVLKPMPCRCRPLGREPERLQLLS
jgi:hypothetical protein